MSEIGQHGGVVLRTVTTARGRLKPGTEISPDEALSWPIANKRALEEGQAVRWHSLATGASRHASDASGRHVVNRGFGKFDVIEGTVINAEPLSKEEAEALAAEAAERKLS
jgi:hypothetical protein